MPAAINFSISVHAAPTRAKCSPSNGGALTLSFGAYDGAYPDITMFCESAELATDLHAAIAGVLAKHAERSTVSEQGAA